MKIDRIKFKGYRCFKDQWSGFDEFKPLNIIIGKNNSGKTHLLKLVEWLCEKPGNCSKFDQNNVVINAEIASCEFSFHATITPDQIESLFSSNISGGHLSNYPEHGRILMGQGFSWEVKHMKEVSNFTPDDPGAFAKKDIYSTVTSETVKENRIEYLSEKALQIEHDFIGKRFCSIRAERDIVPEDEIDVPKVAANGRGATSTIEKFLNSAETNYPREIIREKFLDALNEIFAPDICFTEIFPQKHGDKASEEKQRKWEIYLGEKKKGLIALSASGSGLKTVLLVLLNLLVIPEIDKRSPADHVFVFEELENNMHPFLLRRLLIFIEKFAHDNNTHIFLTTHSNVALDIFAGKPEVQIIQVVHNGTSAHTQLVSSYMDCLSVIDSLGAKPSDLLQANGIIWVEGPSDRIIVNKWIELASDGKYEEGRHYQCAFYGGSLLSAIGINTPNAVDEKYVNLLSINTHCAIICDSDRNTSNAELKERVKRIKAEAQKLDRFVWILSGREIENYYPGQALSAAYSKKKNLPNPEKCERFFKSTRARELSYSEKNLNNKSLHQYKNDLARRVIPHLTTEMMNERFDWKSEMERLIEVIKSWNSKE